MSNVWWCNQTKCWSVEQPAGIIGGATNCARPKYRQMVMEARPGDVVVHYRSGSLKAIYAVSMISTEPRRDIVRVAGTARCWPHGEEGWFCEADYVELNHLIPKAAFLRDPAPLRNDDGPLVKGDRIRRAYFMRFTPEGLASLHALSTGNWPSWAILACAQEVDAPEIVSRPDDRPTPPLR